MTFEKSSEHLRNSLIMLEIGWKSFGNRCWPYFEVIVILLCIYFTLRFSIYARPHKLLSFYYHHAKIKTVCLSVCLSSKIFQHLRLSSEVVGKSSEVVANLRRSFEIFGNLPKPSVNLRKFRFCGDEKSHVFYRKNSPCRATETTIHNN